MYMLQPEPGRIKRRDPRRGSAGSTDRPRADPSPSRKHPSREGARGAGNRRYREIPATGLFHQVTPGRRIDLGQVALAEVRQAFTASIGGKWFP